MIDLILIGVLGGAFVGGWYAHRKFETIGKMWAAFKALFD